MPMLPATTGPLCKPIRTRSGARPRPRRAALSAVIAAAMARAARRARPAWSGWSSGAPQKAMTQSPMNLSMVPPSASTQRPSRSKWAFSRAATSAAGIRSAAAVKSTMSVNITVTTRSVDGTAPPLRSRRRTRDFGT